MSPEQAERLERFSRLGEGWDSYGGKPLTEAALHTGRRLLEALDDPKILVVPTTPGGIQLELGGDLELEISPDGTTAGVLVEGIPVELAKRLWRLVAEARR